MKQHAVLTRVLITVMTYPHPSTTYTELVCTAGVTENLDWVRIYPLDYRYRPGAQRFRKYQWVEVELRPRPPNKDKRPESREPVLESLRVISPPLAEDYGWRARRRIIDNMPHYTVRKLMELYERDYTSLGIVRPSRVLDLEIRGTDPDWKPEWKALRNQTRLFGPPVKELRKLPYSFHYIFECSDSSESHVLMCEDWELGVLFLKEVERLGSALAAAQSVKRKFLDELCGDDRDTRFFVGTRWPFNQWMVLGVFWPPMWSAGQTDLFL